MASNTAPDHILQRVRNLPTQGEMLQSPSPTAEDHGMYAFYKLMCWEGVKLSYDCKVPWDGTSELDYTRWNALFALSRNGA